jgi:quercetin dioxygenase-like cupin family protein
MMPATDSGGTDRASKTPYVVRRSAWLFVAALLHAQMLPAAAQEVAAAVAAGPVELEALEWRELANGVKIALFMGNPAEAGPYALRARLPPHWQVAPHTHPEDARVTTVISGTLYWAMGEVFDEAKLQPLGPGSVIIEPKDVAHYAMTKQGGAELQITSIGPAGMTFLPSRD